MTALGITATWEQVQGVKAGELSATWCRLSISVNGQDVTLLRSADGSVGPAVYVSAYPLAEWLAENWWTLWGEQRAAVRRTDDWSWRSSAAEAWRQRHNICGAGGGMFWPDLALVPEGSLVHAVWWPRGAAPGTRGASYIGRGDEWISVDDARDGAASFVNRVVDRLDDQGIHDTPLQRSWQLTLSTSGEEAEFAAAVARLGEDPYALDDGVADSVLSLAETLDDGDLLGEFLDSVPTPRMLEAVAWVNRVDEFVARQRPQERRPLPFAERFSERVSATEHAQWRPYEFGYVMARLVREELDLEPVQVVDLRPLVQVRTFPDNSGGIDGYVPSAEALQLAVPERTGDAGRRFRAAQALGLAVLAPARRRFILDPSKTDLAQASRAFAAELLAPAAGVSEQLRVLLRVDDDAIEAIAKRYQVSPIVVAHQYENQVAPQRW